MAPIYYLVRIKKQLESNKSKNREIEISCISCYIDLYFDIMKERNDS